VWKAFTRGDRKAWLLLSWITLPLLLFSTAQTKLGWYISMVYPAVALLVGLALAELLSDRLALGVAAAIMLICCLRVPIPSDGSRDVKQFALHVAQSVSPSDPIYVFQQVCAPRLPSSTLGTPLIPIGDIRPSLRFYLDNPLICLEEREVEAGLYSAHGYFISRQDSWSRVSHLGRVVLENSGFVLARSD
jgi:hypothetical protein